MLVLSRKLNEDILIGDDIQVRVLEIKGCSILIGINAPKNISVHRKEVYERIKIIKMISKKSSNQPEILIKQKKYPRKLNVA